MAFSFWQLKNRSPHWSSRLSLLSAVLVLSSTVFSAATAAEFNFHEAPPRGIPGSFWATEVINGYRLAIDSWLTPPRDCETRLWQASLDQSCSPERQAVFDGAIDEAFQIWQTQAVAAVRATGGTPLSAVNS